MKKIRGQQDPSVNDGTLVSSVTIAPHDGVLLIRRSDPQQIRDATFVNGSFVRVYDVTGAQKQNGFFAQRTDIPIGVVAESSDIDLDGSRRCHYREQRRCDNSLWLRCIAKFSSIGTAYTGNLFLAIANTNRDPLHEIVIGRDGAPPDVRVFSSKGVELNRWTAYYPRFAGGVRVAAGDLDGDGLREIVTAAGPAEGRTSASGKRMAKYGAADSLHSMHQKLAA